MAVNNYSSVLLQCVLINWYNSLLNYLSPMYIVEYPLWELICFSFSFYNGRTFDLGGLTPDLFLGKSEEDKCQDRLTFYDKNVEL